MLPFLYKRISSGRSDRQGRRLSGTPGPDRFGPGRWSGCGPPDLICVRTVDMVHLSTATCFPPSDAVRNRSGTLIHFCFLTGSSISRLPLFSFPLVCRFPKHGISAGCGPESQSEPVPAPPVAVSSARRRRGHSSPVFLPPQRMIPLTSAPQWTPRPGLPRDTSRREGIVTT